MATLVLVWGAGPFGASVWGAATQPTFAAFTLAQRPAQHFAKPRIRKFFKQQMRPKHIIFVPAQPLHIDENRAIRFARPRVRKFFKTQFRPKHLSIMFLPPPISGMFWGAGVWGAWVWGGAAQLLIPGTPIVYSHFSWKKSPRPWKRKVKQFPHRKSSLGGLVIPGKPVGVYMPVPGPSSSGLAGTTQLFSLQQAPPELYVIGVGQPMLYDLPAEKNLYLPPAQLTLAQLTFPLDLRFVNEGAIAIIDLGSVSDIVILYLDLGLA